MTGGNPVCILLHKAETLGKTSVRILLHKTVTIGNKILVIGEKYCLDSVAQSSDHWKKLCLDSITESSDPWEKRF